MSAIPARRILEAARTGGELARAADKLLRVLQGEAQVAAPEHERRLAEATVELRGALDARGGAETLVALADRFGIVEELELEAVFHAIRQALEQIERTSEVRRSQ